MIKRILLLAVLFTSTIAAFTNPAILPEKIDPDTFNIMTLPWVRSVESYRSVTSDMEVDEEGNLYVCGYFEQWVDFGNGQILAQGDNHSVNDIFLAKYDPLGNLLWVNTAGSKDDDKALALAISGNNVYITGYFAHICYFGDEMILTKDRQNMYLANYDRTGNLKWVKQASSDGIVRGLAIAADNNGNAYVTGNFREYLTFGNHKINSQLDKNSYLVKFDSIGEVSWLRQFSGGTSLITYLYVYDVACDSENNIVLSGEMMGKVQFDHITYTTNSEYLREGALPRREVFMAKYNDQGSVRWLKSAGLECNFGDLAIGPNDDILITGYFKGTLDGSKKGQAKFGEDKYLETHYDLFGDNTEDAYVVRYDKNGYLKWATSFGGIAADRGRNITTDQQGNVYVTGFFTGKMEIGDIKIESKKYRVEEKDIFTARIDADGNLNWIERAGSSKEDMGNAIIADSHGNVYVGGSFQGNANFGQNWVTSKMYQNAFVAKYHAQPRD